MKRVIFILVLIIICILLCIGDLYKYHYVSNKILGDDHDFIGAVRDLVTIIAIIIGGFLSYFRFFMGRTFSAKADIEFEVTLIKTPTNSILHTVKFAIVNRGTLAIISPVARIAIKKYGQNQVTTFEEIIDLKEYSGFKDIGTMDYLVDVGEKAFFLVSKEFDASIWAITYSAEVRASTEQIWRNSITVANKIEDQKN